MNNSNDFQPNWASTPGDTISDILKDRKLSLGNFAKKMNSTIDQVRALLHGYISITDEIANKLEKSLGASAEFWKKREHQYRESIKRLKKIEEEKWMTELPLDDMIKFGWIKKSQNTIHDCLDYFKVPDVWTWRRKYSDVTALTAFRKSNTIKSVPAAVSAWLRQGEIQGDMVECKKWDSLLFKKTLKTLRSLTKKKNPKDFIPVLMEKCAECGVAVSIVRTPKGCTASGATYFINSEKALILLSFRYLSDDHFWFTFFHEAGHLLLHGDRQLFIEEEDEFGRFTIEEKEANEFASEMLIPKEFQQRLRTMKISKRELMNFAKDTDVSLGIVIGQLQHLQRVKFENLNTYKRRYTWDIVVEHTQPRK